MNGRCTNSIERPRRTRELPRFFLHMNQVARLSLFQLPPIFLFHCALYMCSPVHLVLQLSFFVDFSVFSLVHQWRRLENTTQQSHPNHIPQVHPPLSVFICAPLFSVLGASLRECLFHLRYSLLQPLTRIACISSL